MRLKYSNFPALQAYLPGYIKQIKTNPLERLLIVTPSGRLARYMQAFITKELGHTSNIVFKKFSSIAPAVDKESSPSAMPPLADNALQDFILKNIIAKSNLSANLKRGYIPALKETLRDLGDAMIDPAVIKEHAKEGAFGGKEENEYIMWLTDIYNAYQQASSSVPGYRSYVNYYKDVIDGIKDNKMLASFKHIIFYGFYDFTGTQLEIFNTLRTNFETTLFFPYQKNTSYKFITKLFETNIIGAAQEIEEISPANNSVLGESIVNIFNPLVLEEGKIGKNENISIYTASGAKDEVVQAAKTILDLVQNQGIKYNEIALCARTLEGYKDFILEVFEENKIPLNTTFKYPLLSQPLAVFCLNLLNLERNGFYKEDILGIVASPYFNVKNNWRGVIEKSLAQRDYAQWLDLVKNNNDEARAFLNWLEKIKNILERLNKDSSWQLHSSAALEILETYVNKDIFDAQESALYQRITELIKNMSNYSLVRESAQENEFLEEVYNIFYEDTLTRASLAELGVSADNIMNLRGRSFKAVVILGVNEKVLPQIIREDPVLRDSLRRTLRDVQGFFIGQKLDRFEEEKIFFYFALEAAKEKIILSFQRSDEDGKPQTPSLYLSELCRAAGIDLENDVKRVGRRELEKCFQTPEILLSQKEMSLKISSMQDPSSYYKAAGFEDCAQSNFAAAQSVSKRGDLNGYDGVTHFGKEIYDKAAGKGFSASALQVLAQCPMRYFLKKGVGIEEEKEVYKRDEFAANLKGSRYHAVLQILYQSVKDLSSLPALLAKLEDIMTAELPQEMYKEYGIYPVVWQVIVEKMKKNLREFVTQDFEQMLNFTPAFFEKSVNAAHDFNGNTVKLYGEIDRVDTSADGYRIIDYKSAQKSAKDLSGVILKKQYFQPVIYWILAANIEELKGLEPQGFSFLNLEGGFFRRSLTPDGFNFIQEKFAQMLNLILDIVRQGKFFINDGDHCQYCSYSAVCRKGSGAALVRARNSAYAKELEVLKDA